MKYADDIVSIMNDRGSIKVPEDCTTGEEFDKWMHRANQGGRRMTDVEQKRIQAICEVAHINDIGDLSDGYHTFNQLYYQRMMLFAVLVKQNRDKAWKSLRHEDGELCFGGGWFIVGIDTPEGSYTYHYENKYFDLFDCEILDHGKHWDGHTEKDVTRLLSLEQEPALDKIRERLELEKLGYPPSAEYYKAIMKVLQIIDKERETKYADDRK